MIRRFLLGTALVAASLSRLNCDLVFPLDESINPPFLGCFKGPITDPPGPGEVTIVLEAEGGIASSMVGCFQLTSDPRIDATLAGEVLKDRTQARFDVMPIGRPLFVLLVTRQPADGNATGVDLVNESAGGFFRKADDLPRCATTLTCEDLGITQNFMPGGAP
jgi:hypothetical protein